MLLSATGFCFLKGENTEQNKLLEAERGLFSYLVAFTDEVGNEWFIERYE